MFTICNWNDDIVFFTMIFELEPIMWILILLLLRLGNSNVLKSAFGVVSNLLRFICSICQL